MKKLTDKERAVYEWQLDVPGFGEEGQERLKNASVPIMLSIGGRSKEEISDLVEYFDGLIEVLMVGFQAFPSKIQDVKLEKISILGNMFKDLSIGYADHSSYADDQRFLSNYCARMLGATHFEKHLTLALDKSRVDHNSAMPSDELAMLIQHMKSVDEVLGNRDDRFQLSKSEQKYRERQLKVVVTKNVNEGECLTEENVGLRMIDKFGGYERMDMVLGKVSTINLTNGTLVSDSHLANK